jgi:hypothetical protein
LRHHASFVPGLSLRNLPLGLPHLAAAFFDFRDNLDATRRARQGLILEDGTGGINVGKAGRSRIARQLRRLARLEPESEALERDSQIVIPFRHRHPPRLMDRLIR